MRRALRATLLGVAAVVIVAAFVVATNEAARGLASFVWTRLRGGYTVAERVSMHGAAVEGRLRARFERAGLAWPPVDLAYVAFKDVRRLEVHARSAPDQPWRHVLDYPVLGASGGPGPKLADGDRQVPEGIYAVESLNPNSRFHLSIRLNYPNDFDRRVAQADGRNDLGSDIMIHGSSSSIGCLAMGDQAAEDLFILAALAGRERVRIVVSPTDLRQAPTARVPVLASGWVGELYAALGTELQSYRP